MNVILYKEQNKSRHQGRKLRARSEIRLPTPLPPATANCSVRTADAIGRRWARVRQKRGPEGRKTWLTEAGGEHPLLSTAEAKKRTVEAEEIRLQWKVEGQAAGGCLRVLLFCYLYSTLNQTWLSCDMLHRTVQIKLSIQTCNHLRRNMPDLSLCTWKSASKADKSQGQACMSGLHGKDTFILGLPISGNPWSPQAILKKIGKPLLGS